MKKVLPVQFAGALVLIVIMLSLYGYAYAQVSLKSAELKSLTLQISKKTLAAADAGAARAQLAALAPQEATLQQYFLSNADIVSFLEQLATTGKYFGSKVEVVSVAAVPGTPNGALNLSLTVTGSFDAVMRTVGAIEYGPHETTVTNFTLTTMGDSSQASSSPQWQASATFLVGTQNSTTTPSTP
jgi:Tfp pilus assembly protein PilO